MGPLTAETARTASAPDRLRARLATPAEDLVWLAVIGGALAVAAAFIWLAPPLSKLYPSPINDVFGVWEGQIDPEPLEEVRSMLALATPILVAAIVLAFGSPEPSRRLLDPLVVVAQVIGIGLLTWVVLEQPGRGLLLAPGYFYDYLLSIPNLVAGVLIGVGLTVVAIRAPGGISRPRGAVWGRLARSGWIPLGIAILATVIWLLPAVFTDSTLPQSGSFAAGHVPGQGEDYFSVVNGRTPLVNYIAQYANLLPLVLAPVLKVFRPSITSYSITMCVVSGVGMLAVFGMFTQVTRHRWAGLALFVPWVALSLFPWHDFGSYREFNGIYYGVFPGRYFGPFLLALLCVLSIRGRRIPTFALFGFAGLVVLNNYEFGLAALFALIAALGVSWDRAVPLPRRLLDLLLQGATGVIAAIVLVCAVTLVRTGELPDPSLLTYFNRLFLRDSFGLEPMSALGLHWALFATYAAALLLAAVRYIRNESDRALTGMLAFSGIFGLITGMYFVGRSSQFQLMLLFPAWGLALALVALTAAISLRAAREDRGRLRRQLVPGAAALVGFGVMISAIGRAPEPHIAQLGPGETAIDLGSAEHFVEAHTHPGEHVLILGPSPEHLVAYRAGVVNVSPLNGVTSLISPAEANRALDQLEADGGNQVFEGTSAAVAGGSVFAVPELATILQQRGYRPIGGDPSIHLRWWRQASD